MDVHPELLRDAERVLDEAGYPHKRILDVLTDAILYENKCHQARTLWMARQEGSGRLKVKMVKGFPCQAPAGWPDS